MEIVKVESCPGYKNQIGVMKAEDFIEFMHLLMMNTYKKYFDYVIPKSFDNPTDDFSI